MFDDPDLIVTSVVVPLDNVLLVVTVSAFDVKSLTAEGLNVESVISAHEVGWDQLPEFIDLLVWLTANNSCTIVLTCAWNLDCLMSLGTENTVLVSSKALEVELLIGPVAPFVNDQVVVIVGVLGNVQDHVARQSADNFVVCALNWGPTAVLLFESLVTKALTLVVESLVLLILMVIMPVMMSMMTVSVMSMSWEISSESAAKHIKDL